VCVFETQKRGAWHAHIAVPRVLSHYLSKGQLIRSYDLLRSMWRGVVGSFEGKPGGNVDVSRNKRVNRSASKLATYISKYIGKTFDQADKHVNSYSASGRSVPPSVVHFAAGVDQWDAIAQLAELVSYDLRPNGEFHLALLQDCGGAYICVGPPPLH
jgi:hypothetical protein